MRAIFSIWVIVSVALFSCALWPGCSDKNPVDATVGFISVLVMDSEEGPVADVLITVNPGNREARTGENGLAIFAVPPGDYFVDAQVCCIGPRFIPYHEPVTVVKNDTSRVQLNACLRCL